MANTDSLMNAIALMKQREAQERANSLNPLAIIAGIIGGGLPGVLAGGAFDAGAALLGGLGGAQQRGDTGVQGAAQAGLGAYNTGVKSAANENLFKSISDNTVTKENIVGLAKGTDYAENAIDAYFKNKLPPYNPNQPYTPDAASAGTNINYTGIKPDGTVGYFTIDSPDDLLDPGIKKWTNVKRMVN